MAICPHCETHVPEFLDPCPTGDGYHGIAEEDFAAFRGDAILGRNIVGRFIVTSVIGHGAIGRVYKAHQLGVERDVVLKVFNLSSLVDRDLPSQTLIDAREDARARFIREARILGRLNHPNCVMIHDFGSSEGGDLLYIAMEYVVGVSLRDALSRGIKPQVGVAIMRQILDALSQAHTLDIVHRDLKPENIILSFRDESVEPQVKVLDFGIAKLVGNTHTHAHQTSAGMLFGTPAYMAPEQCRGDIDRIGAHTDVYAFGCVAYEVVTGRLPFEGETPQQYIQMHQEAPVPEVAPRHARRHLEGVGGFIEKCLGKEPGQRYGDARVARRVYEGLLTEWTPPKAAPLDETSSAEISALRTTPQTRPSQASVQTYIGASPEALPEEVPTDGRTAMGPSLRADSQDNEVSWQVGAAIGGALLLVVVFCALLFYFFYQVI